MALGDPPVLAQGLVESYSFASSSSSNDLFQVNVTALKDDHTFSIKPDGDAPDHAFKLDGNGQPVIEVLATAFLQSNDEAGQTPVDDGNAVSINSSSQLEESPKDSPRPSSALPPLPVSGLTHGSSLHTWTTSLPPPVQVMNRSQGYEPDRIPSVVFTGNKSTIPMDWSVASNESLFSLHIGSNSFSRDHSMGLGGELGKSGELRKSGELNSPTLAATIGENDRKSMDIEKKVKETRVGDEFVNGATRVTSDDRSEGKMPSPQLSWNSSSISHPSNGSGASSACSSAFPTKKRHAARPLCCGSNCSWAFCYCTWPSCYCSKCSWGICYSWNCKQKRHGFSSQVSTGGTKSGTPVVEGETKPRKASGEVKSKSTTRKWFPCSCCSCFSCSSCSHSPCSSCSHSSCSPCSHSSCSSCSHSSCSPCSCFSYPFRSSCSLFSRFFCFSCSSCSCFSCSSCFTCLPCCCRPPNCRCSC